MGKIWCQVCAVWILDNIKTCIQLNSESYVFAVSRSHFSSRTERRNVRYWSRTVHFRNVAQATLVFRGSLIRLNEGNRLRLGKKLLTKIFWSILACILFHSSLPHLVPSFGSESQSGSPQRSHSQFQPHYIHYIHRQCWPDRKENTGH